MKPRCVFQPLAVVAVLFSSLPVFAQGPEPRLKRTITETARAVLPNSRTPRVREAEDMGAVSPDTAVPGITLVFRRSDAQEAALQELLTVQQNRTSPQYHQWLTPESFAARFGVADGDIAATESWLSSHGFHVDSVARSRDRITFSGTAGQVQAAFGSGLRHYRVNGEMHFAPEADLTLPEELASVTAAVVHLSDFRPKPQYKVQSSVRPDYTTTSTQTHYLDPQDVATMYDLNPLYQKLFYGYKQSLAVVGQSFVVTSTVNTFQSASNSYYTGLGSISTVLVPGSGVQGFLLEMRQNRRSILNTPPGLRSLLKCSSFMWARVRTTAFSTLWLMPLRKT
jgi:Pro-kumamolisin, activation domain